MRNCVVPGCPNARQKIHCRNKTFFKFPVKNAQLLQVWLKNIGKYAFKPSNSSIICSDHFLEDSYVVCPFTKMRKLKPGAVPVIFHKTPEQTPQFFLFSSTSNGNYAQLNETQQVFPGPVPSFFVNSPSFTSSELFNSSENPYDRGKIKEPEIIIPGPVNLQEQAKKEEFGQISTIQQPCEQLNLHNPTCVPVLLNNNTMILLPLSLNQAPTAISGTESQNVAETSIGINQEPVKSADEPPRPVIKEVHQTEQMASPSMNSLPAISPPSIISLSTFNSSSSYNTAPFPESALPFAHSSSTNVVETSSAIKQEPVESAAAPLPNCILPDVLSYAHPNSTNAVETSNVIKQEPIESAAAPPSDCILPDFAYPNSTNVAETSIVIKQEPVESVDEPPKLINKIVHLAEEMASSSRNSSPIIGSSFSISSPTSSSSTSCSSAPIPQHVLPLADPDSTNTDETPTTHIPNKSTQKRTIFINCILPFPAGLKSNAAQAKLRRRTKPSTPSKQHPSAATSKKSSPAVTSKKSSPVVTSKKSTERTPRTSQADLYWRTLMSMTSKRNSELHPSAGTSKKSAGHSIELTENGENAIGKMSQSLLDGSETKTSLMSMTSKRNCEQNTPAGPSIELTENGENATREMSQSLHDGSERNPCLTSMTSKRNCEQNPPSEPSTELAENGENATREMLQSLLDDHESNPLCGSRTTERPGDLFDVFADTIADKLRRMDLNECAHALRAIVDIVYKTGEDQLDS